MTYSSKPWLKSYDSDVQPEIEIPDITLKDYMEDVFAQNASQTAFHYLTMSMIFEELLEQSGKFAKVLTDNGLGKGDVVSVCLPNTPHYLIAVVGTIRAGCVLSGLAPLFMPDEMAYQLNDCGAKALVMFDMLFDAKLAGIADQLPDVKLVMVAGATDYLPGVSEYPAGKPLEGKKVGAFKTLVDGAENQPPTVDVVPADRCYLQYTGGTTGVPKGVILSHGNMIANLTQFSHWSKAEPRKTWMSAFPLFHMAGLFISTMALTFAGTQVLIPDPRNIELFVKQFDALRPSYLINVPSLYFMLMADEAFCKLDFSAVQWCMSGAAPFPADKINALEDIVGKGKLLEVWGMTETSPLLSANPVQSKKRIGSVGLPLSNTKVRVVSTEDGVTDMPIGEEGEVIACGPQVMQGYLNKPEETAKTLREHDGETWMYTGDVAKMDKDGFLYIVDRAKDMLIVGGFKVFSSEVENKLYQHPAIELCAIVGLPNPERPDSEIVKLIVQKSAAYQDKPNDQVQTEIETFAKETLAPYKVPKVYEFTDAIPLTSVGKIDKKLMRKV
jgi:long-chain acyl-CoA synthetase